MDIIQNSRPIAILLAVYNGEKYLAEQIDSLLAQTNQDWTLYIRNDASTDSTQSIIDRYCEAHPGKMVEIDKGGPNLKCSGNFMRLLEVVESDYYMFCDADDVWLPEKVTISYEAIRAKETKYKEIPLMVDTDYIICDAKLNELAPSGWRKARKNPDLFLKYRYLAVCPTIGGSTSIFNNRAKHVSLPGPRLNVIYDAWVAMMISKKGKIFTVHKPLKKYRQHDSNEAGAQMAPYKFNTNKFWQLKHIVLRDNKIARELKRIGYGPVIKFYICRVIVLIKFQWSKITYR